MKVFLTFLLFAHLALIGCSVAILAGLYGQPSPATIGVQVSSILCNLAFGGLNFRNLIR